MAQMQNEQFQIIPGLLFLLVSISCTGPNFDTKQPDQIHTVSPSNLALVLEPEQDDVAFLKAISDDQEKQLSLCKEEDACRTAHFLRGLSALYENRELAALHFRKVVVSRPNSLLARESRFWLWFLDVLNTPNNRGFSMAKLIKKLTREVVDKELAIHELAKKLEGSSVDGLKRELAVKDEVVKKMNLAVGNLSNQLELTEKKQALHQDVEQALKVSEKKVEELTNQLEALRRIDQEIREKVPPTRPSEKMTPSLEVEQPVEDNEDLLQKSQP